MSRQTEDASRADAPATSANGDAVPFDFRRQERTPQAQLSAIEILHEGFLRTLASSLSSYLRSDVSGNLVCVEQLSYGDLADRWASPTCLVYLALQPHESSAVVEVQQSLLSPILDCVLGGSAAIKTELDREITEIEQDMLGGFFRILGHDLTEAWKVLAPIEFAFDGVEMKPQLSKRIGRNEAVLAIVLELRVGDATGTVTIGIPSLILKLLRNDSDQPAPQRKSGSAETEAAIRQRLAEGLLLELECALLGSSIRLRDLLQLKPGDLLDSGIPCDSGATLLVNGIPKFHGEVIADGNRQTVVIQ